MIEITAHVLFEIEAIRVCTCPRYHMYVTCDDLLGRLLRFGGVCILALFLFHIPSNLSGVLLCSNEG